jgi:hypothetical protein
LRYRDRLAFRQGTIDGVDVSGRTIAVIAHVPRQHPQGQLEGRRLPGRARHAGPGGRVARGVYRQEGRADRDLVKLIGEVVSVEKVPVTFTVQGGRGR